MTPDSASSALLDIDTWVAIAQIVGALATAGALWVMIRTLQEMKRQTDLSSNPNLRIRFKYLPKLRDDHAFLPISITDEIYNDESHETWLAIITRNLHQDLSALSDSFLTIEFTNAGKSEITNIQCEISLTIRNFDNFEEVTGYGIEPQTYTYPVNINPDLGERQVVRLPIANTRYFPIFDCSISRIRYSDVRSLEFTHFDGPTTTTETSNDILRPNPAAIALEAEAGPDDMPEEENSEDFWESVEPTHDDEFPPDEYPPEEIPF